MKGFQKCINSNDIKSFIINKNLIHNKELTTDLSKLKMYKIVCNKFPSSIKPISCSIPHDVNITDIFLSMNNKAQNIPSLYMKLPQAQLAKRKSVLENIYKFITKYKIKNKIFYTIIYFYDLIIFKYLYNNRDNLKQINNFKPVVPPYEKLGLGISILVLKYFSVGSNILYLNKFKNFYVKKYFSTLELKILEILCLKLIDYNLDIPSPYHFLELFLVNGIVFKTDNVKMELSNKIYNLVISTLEKIMISNNEYIKYNPLNLCCCIIAYCRETFNIEKWPKILSKVFDIEYKQFEKVYKDYFTSYNLNKYYFNKLHYKLNPIKIHKNMDILCNNNSNENKEITDNNESKNKNNINNKKNNIIKNKNFEKNSEQSLSNLIVPQKITNNEKEFLKKEDEKEDYYKNTANYFYKPKQKGLVLNKYSFPAINKTNNDINNKINIQNFGNRFKQHSINTTYINNSLVGNNSDNSNSSISFNKNYYKHFTVNSMINQSNSSNNIENDRKYLKTSDSNDSKNILKLKMTESFINKYMKFDNNDVKTNLSKIESHIKLLKKLEPQPSVSILTNISECINNNKNINININTKKSKINCHRASFCNENYFGKYSNKENYSNENLLDNSKNSPIRKNYHIIKKLAEKSHYMPEKLAEIRNINKDFEKLSSISQLNQHVDIRNLYKQKKNSLIQASIVQ